MHAVREYWLVMQNLIISKTVIADTFSNFIAHVRVEPVTVPYTHLFLNPPRLVLMAGVQPQKTEPEVHVAQKKMVQGDVKILLQ